MNIDKYKRCKSTFIVTFVLLILLCVILEIAFVFLYRNLPYDTPSGFFLLLYIFIYLVPVFVIIFIWAFISSLFIKSKELLIGNHFIYIYAGFKHKLLFVDYNLKDTLSQTFYFAPIILKTYIGYNYLEVTISTTNNIVVKLNGQLYATY